MDFIKDMRLLLQLKPVHSAKESNYFDSLVKLGLMENLFIQFSQITRRN